VDLARAGSPEVFAEVVVRLVESGRIPSKELQVDLLTDAFSAASASHQAVRWIAIPGIPGDNHAAYVARGSELKLDALSLESAVLKALITVDPAKARILFQSVPHPTVDARPCEDPLIADVSAYYEIAGELAQSAFTPEEKEKNQNAQFLLTALAGAHSPSEMAPFARSLSSVALTPSQLELLLGALGAKLQSFAPDYRPFALTLGNLQQELDGLIRQAQAQGVSTDSIVQGVRSYLVTQLTGPRCAEELLGETPSAVAWFNDGIRGALGPITDDEMKPSKRGPMAKMDPFYTSSDEKHILDEFTRLRSTASGGLQRADLRSSTEWRRLLADLLRDVSSWQPSGSSIDAFNQKANALLGLYQQAPPGEDRDRILSTFLAYLQSASAERQNPAEWLWQVKLLAASAGPDGNKMARAFQDSGDVGLVLYPLLALGR